MSKISTKVVRTLMIVSAMVMMMCMPANASTSSVKAVKVGKTSTIKNTSKVTSTKPSVASAKKKNSKAWKVTALKKGKSTLKVYDKNGKLSQKIFLISYNNKTFKYNTDTLNLNKGESKTVTASTNISGITIKYKSTNSNVASVDANGKITAKNAGSATIKAVYYYKGVKLTAMKKPVTVKNATSSSSNSSSSGSSSSSKSSSSSGSSSSSSKTAGSSTNTGTAGNSSSSNSGSSSSGSSSSSKSSSSSGSSSSSSSGSSSSGSGSSESGFVYHASPSSDTVYGGKTSSITVYCEKASDVVTFTFSNNCAELGGVTTGTCRDSYNHVDTAYYTCISYVGRKAGTCNLDIYINGSFFKTIPITVTSTDDIYYTYQDWKQAMKDEIWTDDMTDREKIDAVCVYIRKNCVYLYGQAGYMGFAIYGGGDCFAQTDLIIDIAHDLGLEAEEYLVNGTYNGHMYALVYFEPGVATKVDIALGP